MDFRKNIKKIQMLVLDFDVTIVGIVMLLSLITNSFNITIMVGAIGLYVIKESLKKDIIRIIAEFKR